MILEEFDANKEAVINPWMIKEKVEGFPDTVVGIFSHQLFARIVEFTGAVQIETYQDADGVWPVYETKYNGVSIGLVKARVGGPSCVGCLEDVLTMGAKKLILLGNCGVLDKNIEDCGIIIPTKAIRDEGTSFHYAPASDFIDVNKKYREEFKAVCEEFGYPYIEGTTWTTDAIYRETRDKVNRRKEMGAICVEMECAPVQAMCDFRGIEFFQFLYAGDNLDHSDWDPRSLSGSVRLDDKEKIALLGLELASRISDR